MKSIKNTGFAIALAWPDTYCKQAGAWYDNLLNWLGIANNNYYKVGHAAILLIDVKEKKCHYFDFGRYHAPFQYGRVRGAETDDELTFKTVPVISKEQKKIENYLDILKELQSSDVFHGSGDLWASYVGVNFNLAFDKAKEMQQISPIAYGPFAIKGSNCSRFVNTVIRAGKPGFCNWFKLYFFNPFTPTPKSNVNCLRNKRIIPKQYIEEEFCPVRKSKSVLRNTLEIPERNSEIPENAIWLSGEGAGSWFVFEIKGGLLKSTRYSPAGNIECTGFYKSDVKTEFVISEKIEVQHPSHCKIISLKVNHKEFKFYRVNN